MNLCSFRLNKQTGVRFPVGKISRDKGLSVCYNIARKVEVMDKRTILIAGMGSSPAVFTETVWALCHQHKPMVRDLDVEN